MNKPKFFTRKFIESAVHFAVYFLAVALTPLLAKPFAPLFDWVGYSALRAMFEEIFVVLFWGIEGLAIYFIEKAVRKRKERLQAEHAQALQMLGVKAPSAPTEEKTDEQVEGKKEKRQPTPPMPLKNLCILTGICAVCIFLVSAVIGFRVKPFYDIGEKISGQELCCAIAVIGRNAFKCIWIVAMLCACKRMADEIVAVEFPDGKEYKSWLIAGGILLLYGIFDIFASVVHYPMGGRGWLLALVYLLFYMAFTAVYCFAEKHKLKTYFLILLIYLF